MQENQNTSSPVNRIVIICGLVSIVVIIGFFVLQWKMKYTPVIWSEESFKFKSGAQCYVFREPKFAIFLIDDDTEEIFDRINQRNNNGKININGFSRLYISAKYTQSKNGLTVIRSKTYQATGNGKVEMQFHNSKMVISERGTKLTLADGREFLLDGKTPLWLRCKSDGTIDHLVELPEGFVEFFESPPPNPGMIGNVKSYPDAFRK